MTRGSTAQEGRARRSSVCSAYAPSGRPSRCVGRLPSFQKTILRGRANRLERPASGSRRTHSPRLTSGTIAFVQKHARASGGEHTSFRAGWGGTAGRGPNLRRGPFLAARSDRRVGRRLPAAGPSRTPRTRAVRPGPGWSRRRPVGERVRARTGPSARQQPLAARQTTTRQAASSGSFSRARRRGWTGTQVPRRQRGRVAQGVGESTRRRNSGRVRRGDESNVAGAGRAALAQPATRRIRCLRCRRRPRRSGGSAAPESDT